MRDTSTGTPEALAHEVVELCADCEHCRELMEGSSCFVFPELFRLADRHKEAGTVPTSGEYKALVDLCNFCGLCPCPKVRTGIRKSKDAFVARDGLKPTLRILEDVQRVGMLCGACPAFANTLLQERPWAAAVKRLAGIHPERQLPKFPDSTFAAWAKDRGLHEKRGVADRKVAYFAGCTAQYLFPEVAKATVKVLEHNGIAVFIPEQKCCGMPSLLEGDRQFTLDRAAFNLRQLLDVVEDGYDIVTSCPTCGYMLKNVFSDGAYMSESYRATLESHLADAGGDANKLHAVTAPGRNKPALPVWLIERGLLRDESYFARLNGDARVKVASNTFDLGEYLLRLQSSGELNLRLGAVSRRAAYYPPCHLREQSIGQPWSELLNLVPGIAIAQVGNAFDCCGMAGVMGFKREFHDVSVQMARPLMRKIAEADPETLLTDCLSCRMQFEQLLSYKVAHPVEVFAESYAAAAGDTARGTISSRSSLTP